MYLRNGVWYYDFVANGQRHQGSTGFRAEESRKARAAEEKLRVQAREQHSLELVWEQTKRRLLTDKEVAVSAADIWAVFSRAGRSVASSSRLRIYRNRLNAFCEWMHVKYPSIKKISEVLHRHAAEYLSALREQPGSPATWNDHLVALKLIFGALGRDYGVIENPFDGIKRAQTSQVPREAFTPNELKLIGEHATGWIYSLCITAVSTGLREGDICMLKRSSVDLNSGWLSIHRTRKTGAAVDIPLLPGLRRHIEARMAEGDSEYVFPELAEMYSQHPDSISSGIKKFFEEIGISGTAVSVPGYKKRASVKDVHSFRHTFVYMASVHGIPLPVVQQIVGHANPTMTRHYMDHAGREAKARYLAELPDYLSGSSSSSGNDARKQLSDLAYSLPIDEVQRLLAEVQTKRAPGDPGAAELSRVI